MKKICLKNKIMVKNTTHTGEKWPYCEKWNYNVKIKLSLTSVILCLNFLLQLHFFCFQSKCKRIFERPEVPIKQKHLITGTKFFKLKWQRKKRWPWLDSLNYSWHVAQHCTSIYLHLPTIFSKPFIKDKSFIYSPSVGSTHLPSYISIFSSHL